MSQRLLPPESSPTQTVNEDDLYDILANRRRRYVLHILKQSNSKTDIGTVAEQVAAWENNTTVQQITGAERKRVYTALLQSHLPKMDRIGIVEFDKNRGTIKPLAPLEDVEVFMEVVRGREIPWSEYYLGLSAVNVALLVAVWTDMFVFADLSGFALAGTVVAIYLLSSVAHYYYSRRTRLGRSGLPPELKRSGPTK